MLFADLKLARRLEMMDALCEELFCRSHQSLFPDAGAVFESFAGGIAAYAGPTSPLTQAFGLGLAGPVDEAEFVRLEKFFLERGAPVNIELCPLADESILRLLAARGYALTEFSNVLVRDISQGLNGHPEQPDVRVTVARREEFYIWSETVARGFTDDVEVPPIMREAAVTFFHESDVKHLLVHLDGVVVAGGAIAINEGIGDIFGTSTLHGFRGRGAQSALIRGCLEAASEAGCTLVMATTACGSTSQRNFERQGFQIVYTRSKFCLDS